VTASPPTGAPSLITVLREWGRIGCIGFGGPPAHIALLRELCVERREWLSADDFEHGIAATNLLPGPGSTQLSIFCAWRLRGILGALVGGAAFIVPGLVGIIALAVLFLASSPPRTGSRAPAPARARSSPRWPSERAPASCQAAAPGCETSSAHAGSPTP
jgi:chromate transporter